MPESVFSLLGMLAIVVLILILAYWTTRWIGTRGMGGFGPGKTKAGGTGTFRVLGQLSIGRNERLVLVRLQDKCYLLGVTSGSVTLLRELEGDDAREWLSEEGTPAPPDFLDVLKENLRKRK